LEAVKTNENAFKFVPCPLKLNTNFIIDVFRHNKKLNMDLIEFNHSDLKDLTRQVDLLIPLKYTFLSTILFASSNCYGLDRVVVTNDDKSDQHRSLSAVTHHDFDTPLVRSNSLQQLNALGKYGVLEFNMKLADYLGIKFPLEHIRLVAHKLKGQ